MALVYATTLKHPESTEKKRNLDHSAKLLLRVIVETMLTERTDTLNVPKSS